MATESHLLDTDCCDGVAVNPKQRMRAHKRPRSLDIYGVQNPIPDEVCDSAELKAFFKKWNFVPYAGSVKESGQSLLAWYQMLAKLSPTHSACISKKLKYAVGGKAAFVRTLDTEFDIGEESLPMTTAEKLAYRDALNEFIEFDDGVGQLHRYLGQSLEATGNAWAELSFSKTIGVGRAKIKAHRVSHCLYVNTKPGEPKVVAVSPKWTDAYLDKHEPRYVPKFPNFTKDVDGVLRTMFHLKNGENSWYGRPESEGSDIYKYREFQDQIYLTKQASANFTGQLIVEVEDDDPEFSPAIDEQGAQEAGFDSFAQRMEHSYTQKADEPQSILVTSRPYGSKPMYVFQIDPNTNENWYKVTGEIAEKKVTMSHGLTLRFMGFDVSNGFATDAFIGDYVMNVEPVIEELMQTLTNFTNKIVSEVWKLVGKEDLNQYSITFMPPIQSAIEEFKTRAPQQTQAQPPTPQPV